MKPYNDNDKSAKVAGAVGTIVVHLTLLLLLLFALTVEIDPPTEEQGLTVNYGTSDLGSGLYEPAPQSAIEDQLVDEPAEAVPTAGSAPSTPASAPDDLIAQETEESLAIKRAEEKRKQEEAEQRRIEQQRLAAEAAKKAEEERIAKEKAAAEAAKKAAEEAAKKRIASSTKNAFNGTGGVGTSNSSTGQGTGASTGNQGNPLGSAAAGGMTGNGTGNGGSGYSLKGRTISGKLPQPSYNKNETGTIVVAIEVNAAGTVISAKAGAQGTTIGDASMRKEAENAAMKAKFNGISGNTVQSGTITYHYKLN